MNSHTKAIIDHVDTLASYARWSAAVGVPNKSARTEELLKIGFFLLTYQAHYAIETMGLRHPQAPKRVISNDDPRYWTAQNAISAAEGLSLSGAEYLCAAIRGQLFAGKIANLRSPPIEFTEEEACRLIQLRESQLRESVAKQIELQQQAARDAALEYEMSCLIKMHERNANPQFGSW